MYKLIIYLNNTDPLPNIGDTFEITKLEDGEHDKFSIPYVVATLQPVQKNKSTNSGTPDYIKRMMGEL